MNVATRPVSRFRFLLCASLLLAPTVAMAQQEPDTSFDVRVAVPALVARHPRVVVDEAHHNFHTMGGRYRPFADLIRNDGCRVEPGRVKFTRESLEGVDVLVISNALGHEKMDHEDAVLPAFTPDEVAAVRDWVSGGGALLLIADHAPMGAAASTLGAAFGVDMRNGYTIDPVQGEGGGGSMVWYRLGKGLAAGHPIVRGRGPGDSVAVVRTFTGQSLAGPPGSTSLLTLSDQAVDLMVGLGEAGPNVPAEKRRPAGGRSQGLAMEFGKGRVVVMAEAAMMTAQNAGRRKTPFGMNQPGNQDRQFALNVVRWLARAL